MLRNGIKHGALHLELFYGMRPSGNRQAQERCEQNRFTVTRLLHYSRDEAQRASLPESVHRQQIAVRHRSGAATGSEVARLTIRDPVTQYLSDARALLHPDDLPPSAAARAVYPPLLPTAADCVH